MSMENGMERYNGTTVYVRTVTYHWVGRVVAVSPREVYLHPAEVVFESGAFTTFFTGRGTRQEKVPTTEDAPACIVRSAIVDLVPWDGSLADD